MSAGGHATRRLGLLALVVLSACLEAPPAAVGDDADGVDGVGDGAPVSCAPPEPGECAPADGLSDDFQNSGNWTINDTDTCSVSYSPLQITRTQEFGCNFTTQGLYDLRCRPAFVTFDSPASTDDVNVAFGIELDTGAEYYLERRTTTLVAASCSGDCSNEEGVSTEPFDPEAHRRWRLTGTPDGVVVEVAGDASGWSHFHTIPAPFDELNCVALRLRVGTRDTPPGSSGVFRDFNIE